MFERDEQMRFQCHRADCPGGACKTPGGSQGQARPCSPHSSHLEQDIRSAKILPLYWGVAQRTVLTWHAAWVPHI